MDGGDEEGPGAGLKWKTTDRHLSAGSVVGRKGVHVQAARRRGSSCGAVQRAESGEGKSYTWPCLGPPRTKPAEPGGSLFIQYRGGQPTAHGPTLAQHPVSPVPILSVAAYVLWWLSRLIATT